MRRETWMGVAVGAALLIAGGAAVGGGGGKDPARGGGTKKAWDTTRRIQDLPGCDGTLPAGAPPGDVAMHDAKKALHDAERSLDRGSAVGVPAQLADAVAIMGKAPDDPKVNWARRIYQEA